MTRATLSFAKRANRGVAMDQLVTGLTCLHRRLLLLLWMLLRWRWLMVLMVGLWWLVAALVVTLRHGLVIEIEVGIRLRKKAHFIA